jgi:2,4-dienoyl-CoA reductase-like NADH-dependent reductase (Old Yellow Enzyme family)
MAPALDALFAPLSIRGLTLRNRFVMPAMQRGFMDDGAPTAQMVDYLRRCAAGGVGLIICESTSPDHSSAYWQPVMGRLDTGTLHAWKKVIDAVHSEGAAIFIQLWHPGAMRKVAAGHPLAQQAALSPSGPILPSCRRPMCGLPWTHSGLAPTGWSCTPRMAT